jgi:hypothetical protein
VKQILITAISMPKLQKVLVAREITSVAVIDKYERKDEMCEESWKYNDYFCCTKTTYQKQSTDVESIHYFL